MSDSTESRTFNWFTPARFGILLALLIFAAFPQVLLGLQTFVVRDYGFYSYPVALFQQACFKLHELPFWDPYSNCGTPFLAQWNTMPLYPPALIYLSLPLKWSLSFFCLAHLWFAGFGMFQLARRWTGNDFAAAFAGVAFSFNGLTLNLLMWPSHIATFSWMPWVVLAVESAWREGGRKIFLASVVGALQMLAGGPETIFLTWLLLLAFWLQQFIKGESPRGAMFWRFPCVVLLVIALSVVQLLPFLDLAAHSERHGNYADFRWSMPAWGWANFLVPMAFGNTWDTGIFFQHGQGWTSSYYLGIGTLWLALLSCARNRRVWLLGTAAAVAFIFALGEHTPVYPALRKLLPLLSLVTYPVKFTIIIAFAAPLLAAFALANPEKIKKQLLPAGVVLFSLIVGILFWTQLAPMPGDEPRAALVNGISRAGFLILTGAVLLVLARKAESAISRAAPLALILIAWLDVYTHEPVQNPTVSPTVYEPGFFRKMQNLQPQPELGGSHAMVTPMAAWQFVHTALGSPQNNFQVNRLGCSEDCNLLDGVPKTDGFFSLMPRECDEFQSLLYDATNADFPRLDDFMGVSQATAPDQIYHWQSRSNFLPLVTAGQEPVFLDGTNTLRALVQPGFDGSKIVFLPPEARAFVIVTNPTAASVLDSHFGFRSVDANIQAAAPSLVVVVQTYYHDWQAYVDGQPAQLLRANHAFQAVQIPAGKHHVLLLYRDTAFHKGALISSITWLVCLTGLFIRLRWRR